AWPLDGTRCRRAYVASRKPAISSGVSPLIRIARQKAPTSRSVTAPSSTCPNRSAACSRLIDRAPCLPRPISLMYWLIPIARDSPRRLMTSGYLTNLSLPSEDHPPELRDARAAAGPAFQARLQRSKPLLLAACARAQVS